MIESMFDLIDLKADAYAKVTEKNLESFLHGFDLSSVIEPCAEAINNKICRNMLRNMADNGGTGVSLEFPGCLKLLIDEAVSKAIEEYFGISISTMQAFESFKESADKADYYINELGDKRYMNLHTYRKDIGEGRSTEYYRLTETGKKLLSRLQEMLEKSAIKCKVMIGMEDGEATAPSAEMEQIIRVNVSGKYGLMHTTRVYISSKATERLIHYAREKGILKEKQ